MKKQDVFVILLSALVFFAIIFYIVYKPEKRETYSKVFNGISSSNVNVKLNNSNLAIIHSNKFYVNVDNGTYLIFLLVYGVDGVLTICHRIMLHENLGEAHRKHAYQLMANELKIGHVKVSLLYMAMQLVVSLGFIYVCPDNVFCHWMYLIGAFLLLAVAYVLFKKKYYHLHEEYLASLKQ